MKIGACTECLCFTCAVADCGVCNCLTTGVIEECARYEKEEG